MDISNELREEIITKKKSLGLSLTEISKQSQKSLHEKPILSVSTLSAIERGKLVGLKEETYRALAEIVGLDNNGKNPDQRTIRIAFGACCWAAPLINAVVKDNENDNEEMELQHLWLTCYANNEDDPIALTKYNQKPSLSDHILTANETLFLLKNNKIDIAFLPILTSEKAPGIVRIARCMNTSKGGVYLFIIGKENENGQKSDLEYDFNKDGEFDYSRLKKIKDVLNEKSTRDYITDDYKCTFVFPKGSIAQIAIEQTLFSKSKYLKQELEIKSTNNFESEIMKRIDKFFEGNEASQYFVYAGWDFHINILKKIFSKKLKTTNREINLIGREFDSYRFTEHGHPFALMSYDCVTTEEKYDYILHHPGLFKLLSILSENVKTLEDAKFKGNNVRYRLINDFLGMDRRMTYEVLDRINWEFLIYPELFSKTLK